MVGGERKSPRPVNIRRQSFINDTPKRRAAGGKYPLPRHLGVSLKMIGIAKIIKMIGYDTI